MKASVYVTLKKSVFDPQGKTIHDALKSMGYSNVADVRQGKFFELSLDGVSGDAGRSSRVSASRWSCRHRAEAGTVRAARGRLGLGDRHAEPVAALAASP